MQLPIGLFLICPSYWLVLYIINSMRFVLEMLLVVVFLVDLDIFGLSPFLCSFVRIVAAVDFPLLYYPCRRSLFLASLSITLGAL
jgi:hypothetical protein